MSKFIKLCGCEYTKIMKKTSTKVMIMLLILGLLAAAGITALTTKVLDMANDAIMGDSYKDELQEELDSFKRELDNNGNLYEEASKNDFLAKIDTYQFAIDNEINGKTSYWKSDIVFTNLYKAYEDMYNYKSLGQDDQMQKEQEKIEKIKTLVKNNDFNGYISFLKEEAKAQLDSTIIDQDAYDSRMYIYALREKYEIGKNADANEMWKSSLLAEMELLKESLATGINQFEYKALTEKTYAQTENRIKIDEYRLEHNLAPYATTDQNVTLGSNRKVYDYLSSSVIQFVLSVMIIVIAGTSISSEITKGTIKFWSFLPYKRWKVLLSKLVVITFLLAGVTIVVSLLSSVVGNIFFGASNAQGYLYVSGGNVHEINYVLYSVIYNLVGAIEIFVFMVFALMLSTITRNSAVAVAISLAAFLGGSTVMQIINIFVKNDWIKFIPFNNLSLTSRIFQGDISYNASSMISGLTGNIPVGFSFAVLGVCVVLMLVTMFDSFRKRDIL